MLIRPPGVGRFGSFGISPGGLLVPAPYVPDPTAVLDSFTDPNDTPITSHVGETQHSWTKHPGSGLASVFITANRARLNSSSGTNFTYSSWVPGSPDYDIRFNLTLITDNNSSVAGVMGRMDTVDTTCVSAHYNTTDDAWKLFETVVGVNGPVTTIAGALSGQTFTLRFRGNRVAFLIDGVEVGAITTAVLNAGRAGIKFSGTSGGTVGVHLDNFQVKHPAPLRFRPPAGWENWPEVHVGGAVGDADGVDGTTDARIVFDSPVTRLSGLQIINWRNVVVMGGEVDASGLAAGRTAAQMRGVNIQNNRGEVHIEGLLQKGLAANLGTAGALGDGFILNNGVNTGLRKSMVTLQNCRIEHARAEAADHQTGTGAYVGNEMHPDIIQAFNSFTGALRLDRFTAYTSYQGIFTQTGSPVRFFDFSRVDINGRIEAYDGVNPTSAYLYYCSSDSTLPKWVFCKDCYAQPTAGKSRHLYISHDPAGSTIGSDPGFPGRHFGDVVGGLPPEGEWTPAGVAGMTYDWDFGYLPLV